MGALTGVAGQSKQSAFSFYVLTKHVYQNWHPPLAYRCILLFFWWKHLHKKGKASVIMHVLNCLIPIYLQVLNLPWAVLVRILIWFSSDTCFGFVLFCFAAGMLLLVLGRWHLHWMLRFCLLYVEIPVYLQMFIKFWVYIKQGNEDMQMKHWEITMSVYNKWLNTTKKSRNAVNLAKIQLEYIKICYAIKMSV